MHSVNDWPFLSRPGKAILYESKLMITVSANITEDGGSDAAKR